MVEALQAVRLDFSPRGSLARRRLLRKLSRTEPGTPRDVKRYHAALLFALAHPDDTEVLAVAEREIGRLGEVLRRRPALARRLVNSGIESTDVEATFGLDLAQWLLRRQPRGPGTPGVEIAWDDDGSAGEALDDLLPACVGPALRDGLLEQSLTTKEWMALAAGGAGRELAWLVRRLGQLDLPAEVLDRLFEPLEIPIRFRAGSWTQARFPARPPFHQREPLLRGVGEHAVLEPLSRPRRVAPRAGEVLVDAARTALAFRSRETDAITWADPRQVALFRLERGCDVALYPMVPQRRHLPESYIGYMAARNRVPVAYGGARVLGDRGEVGINVFDQFRGGESAWLFAQILRVYHHHCGVRRFGVDPYQFGAGNREAIASGAFWFYWRLGFRPTEPRLAGLAEAESARIRAEPGYRTPPVTLRRFAKGRLALDLGAPVPDEEAPDAIGIALEVTRALGRRFGGDAAAAQRWALGRSARLLGADPRRLGDARRRALERFSPIVALLPGLERWPAAERRRLLAVVFAKGGRSEHAYVRALRAHRPLCRALAALGRAGRAAAIEA